MGKFLKKSVGKFKFHNKCVGLLKVHLDRHTLACILLSPVECFSDCIPDYMAYTRGSKVVSYRQIG